MDELAEPEYHRNLADTDVLEYDAKDTMRPLDVPGLELHYRI